MATNDSQQNSESKSSSFLTHQEKSKNSLSKIKKPRKKSLRKAYPLRAGSLSLSLVRLPSPSLLAQTPVGEPACKNVAVCVSFVLSSLRRVCLCLTTPLNTAYCHTSRVFASNFRNCGKLGEYAPYNVGRKFTHGVDTTVGNVTICTYNG